VLEGVPVVEHALWEGFSSGHGAQVLGELEGFGDWHVGLDQDARTGGVFAEDLASTRVEAGLDSADA